LPGRLPAFVRLGLASLLILGCATTVTMSSLPASERLAIQSRHFQAPDSVVHAVAAATLLDLGYSLQLSDGRTGVVQTNALTYAPDPNQDALAEALVGFAVRYRRTVSARVNNGDVKLNIAWESTDRYGWRPYEPKIEVARHEYDTILATIKEQVEKWVYESSH
jgi:hypothetical protein